ncbi:MAG: glycosyltransferase [Lysobacterales bacterium]
MQYLALNLTMVFAAGLIGYTYFGYPLLVAALARIRPKPVQPVEGYRPVVSVVIPTHNGARFLEEKLASLRQQSYPLERTRWLFVADGIDEPTRQFMQQQTDVAFHELESRAGKPSALNLARTHLDEDTEVVVLTDVRQPLSANAIEDLVKALSDPAVGVAGGELVQVQPDGSQAPIGLYWRYEKAIRRSESRFFSTVGASGALYAIGIDDFGHLASDTILDDFEIPIRTLRRGQRTILLDGAVVYDQAEASISGEWRRKVRTLTGNFQSLRRNLWLLSPSKNPAWLQFMSHKLARLAVPWALLMLLICCLAHPLSIVIIVGWLQVLFYAIAGAGLIWPEHLKRVKIVGVCATFLALNTAAAVALVAFIRGNIDVTWKQDSAA